MEKFVPKAREPKPKRRHINLDISEEEYDKVAAAAAKAGVPIRSFARQAVFFAMAHMEMEEILLLEHRE